VPFLCCLAYTYNLVLRTRVLLRPFLTLTHDKPVVRYTVHEVCLVICLIVVNAYEFYYNYVTLIKAKYQLQ